MSSPDMALNTGNVVRLTPRPRPEPTDPPCGFGPGTTGPAIIPLARQLASYAVAIGYSQHGIVANGFYGKQVAHWVKAIQTQSGLPISGYCDADTIRYLKSRFDFDFVAKAKEDRDRVTTFHLADRVVLYWAPGAIPSPDIENISDQLLDLYTQV